MKNLFLFLFMLLQLNTNSQVTVKRSQEIYTMGDSQTSNGGYQTQLISLLGPDIWNYVNYGIPGNTTTQMVARTPGITNGDVNTVILLGGANDLVGAFTATTTIRNLRAIVNAVKNANSNTKVILMTTSPFGTNVGWSAAKQLIQDTLNAAILSSTVITNVDYRLNIYTLLGGGTNTLSPSYDSGDGLHWNATGQSTVGTYIYNNVTFTAFTSTPSITISTDRSLSQDLTPLATPVFKKLTLTDSLKLLNNNITCGSITNSGFLSAGSATISGNMLVTGMVTSLNNFSLLSGGIGGSFTNGGTSIKFLSGSSYPDVVFCTPNWSNGRVQVKDIGGVVLVGDIASMPTNTTVNLQVQTDMDIPIINVKSNSGSQTSLINFIPYASNNSAINFKNSSGTTRGFIDLNVSSGEMKLWGQSGGYFVTLGANGSEGLRLNTSQNIGIGTGSTISARTHIISTTEQLRVGYDVNNYYKTTVGSTGIVTWDAIGSGSKFIFSDNITIPHLIGNTSTPTATNGTGAGTTPTITLINATDLSGLITVDTGTACVGSNATIFTITFNTSYGVAPNVIITPSDINSATLSGTTGVYVTSTTTTFVLKSGSTALSDNTTYKWFYNCSQ